MMRLQTQGPIGAVYCNMAWERTFPQELDVVGGCSFVVTISVMVPSPRSRSFAATSGHCLPLCQDLVFVRHLCGLYRHCGWLLEPCGRGLMGTSRHGVSMKGMANMPSVPMLRSHPSKDDLKTRCNTQKLHAFVHAG